MRQFSIWLGLSVLIGLSACGGDDKATDEAAPSPATSESVAPAPAQSQAERSNQAVLSAVADERRPSADVGNDENRKPVETLAFAGLKPGMTVLELEAGSGYYTEILSRALGPEGTLIMHNPLSFDALLGDAIENRVGGDRLPNVVVSRANFGDLDVEDETVDLATWIQGPHDLWFVLDGERLGEPDEVFADVHRVMAPGGRFLVIDHNAADGTEPEIGGVLHRIHKNHVIGFAEEAGFTLVQESDLLTRSEDPLTIDVFGPSVRGRTSQFVLLFEK